MSKRDSAPFEVRMGSVEALHLVIKTGDLGSLQDALQARLDASPEFFAGDAIVLDVRRLADDTNIDLDGLSAWLAGKRLRPIGVVASSTQVARVGTSLPLLESVSGIRKSLKGRIGENLNGPTIGSDKAASGLVTADAPSTPASPPNPEAGHALFVDKPLRSGQRIYAPGDLVVLDVVSHGAEIIAGGNIHVYAPLRGRALAGAHGNTQARIFSTCFEPELVAIAGVYRTGDQPLPDEIQGKPAHVLLTGHTLRIEPLKLK